jgi:3-hydroxymyristoyl/3-hydroxydecanoyl-(acyl carrier protein) dehydratase
MTAAIILPTISNVERTAAGVRLNLEIAADLPYFRGHFPQVPLLPGVVQLTWAIKLARLHLNISGQFQSLAGIKFMRVIQPGSTVELLLAHQAERNTVEFEYCIESQSCSTGKVRFAT